MERKIFGLLLIAALMLTSCELFEMNIFEGVDVYEPDLGSVSDITTALQNSDPSQWSDEEVDEALDTLNQDLDLDNDGQVDTSFPPDQVEAAEDAAILTIAVIMPASGADEVVDNMVTTMLAEVANETFDSNAYANDPVAAQDLMGGLFGDPQSPADLLGVLAGINTAQDVLTVFNDPSYADGTNSIDVSDSDMASLLQTAVTVTAVSILYDNLDPAVYEDAGNTFSDPGLTLEEQKAEMMFNLMTQDPALLKMIDFADPTALGKIDAEFNALEESLTTDNPYTGSYPYLPNIIDAAGGLTL